MTEKRKAIIIGGGIGGLCTGLALQQLGYEIKIFERVAHMQAVGAGLSIWKNGLAALASLGLDSTFLQSGAPEMLATLRTADGTILSDSTSALQGTPSTALVRVFHRADLQQALLTAVGEANVYLNQACTHIEENGAGVTAVFADGSRVAGDFLIGADGLHSVVRQQLHGQQPPVYAGYTAWRAVIPFDRSRLRPGETWGKGARFGHVPIDDKRVYWFATHNEPMNAKAPQGEKAYLLNLFANWHAPIPDLLAATAEADILRNDIYDRPPLAQWGQGRITLLGDAAHPMTPNMGQGACQAMEDAIVLRNCLRAEGDIAAALRLYEQKRLARTTQFVLRSRRIGEVGQLERPLAVFLRNTLLKLAPASLQAKQLLQMLAFAVDG